MRTAYHSTIDKESPILFCTEMVQAILTGNKTMTRRVVKNSDKFSYGQVGDGLWVRETWMHNAYPDGDYQEASAFYYRADFGENPDYTEWGDRRYWLPSIHMPRCACRLLLNILAIKQEYLLDISEEDCRKEGITGGYPKQQFFKLWDSINGNGSHQLNPLVWVIEFKKVEL